MASDQRFMSLKPGDLPGSGLIDFLPWGKNPFREIPLLASDHVGFVTASRSVGLFGLGPHIPYPARGLNLPGSPEDRETHPPMKKPASGDAGFSSKLTVALGNDHVSPLAYLTL